MVQRWTRSRSQEDWVNSPDADAKDKETMKSFLDMFNLLGRFSSKFSELSVLLKKISDARGPYQPSPQAVQHFQAIQAILGKDIKLFYFGTQQHTTMQTDASIKGLGSVWYRMEYQSTLYFASRTLTPAAKKYYNLECETLATIWGMEHFSHFLFGGEFGLESNQKPLVRIYEKKMDDISHWITKFIYHSLVFRPFKIVYLKGRRNAMQMVCQECPQCHQGGERKTQKSSWSMNWPVLCLY